MHKENTVKLAPNLNAQFINLKGKRLTQVRSDCFVFSKKPPHTIGSFHGIYIEGYYALKLTYKKHALTLIFYDWINSITQVRDILSQQGLELLLSHVYVVVHDGNAHLGFEPAAKAILFALLHRIEPEIAPLLCN
jgi:hypothetical protein